MRSQPAIMKPLYNNSLPLSLERSLDGGAEAYGVGRPNVKVSILETNNRHAPTGLGSSLLSQAQAPDEVAEFSRLYNLRNKNMKPCKDDP